MNVYLFIYLYNNLVFFVKNYRFDFYQNFFNKTYFFFDYYLLNDKIWQEGFLIDFLQKKIADNWVKKFLIYSAYLFNERLVFEKIIRFYLDLLIWPFHKLFIFEFNQISSMLVINIFLFFLFLFVIYFFYVFFLFF